MVCFTLFLNFLFTDKKRYEKIFFNDAFMFGIAK